MNMRNLAYSVFLFILALILKINYPANLIYSPLQDPSLGILAAFLIWKEIENGHKRQKYHPIQIISKFEVYFCIVIGIVMFIIPLYASIEALGLEYALANTHILSSGTLVFVGITWILGSLVPRILYRRGILEIKDDSPKKEGDSLGKLFG